VAPSETKDKFLISQSKHVPFNHARNNGLCAYYKSEEFDITEAALESLRSSEGASEVMKTSSWSEQLPKRWVIVLLCFAAFLLCNMDRVSSFPFPFCHG